MNGLIELVQRVAELERRVSRQMLYGPVTDVDAQKHRIRVRIGGTDQEPMKSPWILYAQIAGALKLHSMPSVGQQMLMFAPDGVAEQALAVPLIWSNQNPSPSSDKDEHVLTFGQARITLKKDSLSIKVGESEIEWTGGKLNLVSGQVSIAGDTYIGQPGKGATIGEKVLTEGAVAEKAWAKV